MNHNFFSPSFLLPGRPPSSSVVLGVEPRASHARQPAHCILSLYTSIPLYCGSWFSFSLVSWSLLLHVWQSSISWSGLGEGGLFTSQKPRTKKGAKVAVPVAPGSVAIGCVWCWPDVLGAAPVPQPAPVQMAEDGQSWLTKHKK